jgi:hypothetical protein
MSVLLEGNDTVRQETAGPFDHAKGVYSFEGNMNPIKHSSYK